jgi:hypothetical protein
MQRTKQTILALSAAALIALSGTGVAQAKGAGDAPGCVLGKKLCPDVVQPAPAPTPPPVI